MPQSIVGGPLLRVSIDRSSHGAGNEYEHRVRHLRSRDLQSRKPVGRRKRTIRENQVEAILFDGAIGDAAQVFIGNHS